MKAILRQHDFFLVCVQFLIGIGDQNTSLTKLGTADYAGIGEWVQLDLQSIQHRDYFGHLSIFRVPMNP